MIEAEPEVEKVYASAWRLGAEGYVISSVPEEHVANMAQLEPNIIYFFSDLGAPDKLTHSEGTMQKVYDALSAQSLSEAQIINAVNAMQNAGIYFRESAI